MRQIYENYTDEDEKVWRLLYERQMESLPGAAAEAYMQGLDKISFCAETIPRFEDMNKVLEKATGWQLVVVPGLVPDYTFFELMSNRRFPATTWLRKLAELDYLQEPDMFHDVFAHVPLLSNKPFVSFLEKLSEIGLSHCGDEVAIELLSRLYWFTVEFGLIREACGLRIYGAGILSSKGETLYSLSDKSPHYAFDVKRIMSTSYRKDVFQDRYFVIDSYEALYASIPEVKEVMAHAQDYAYA